MIIERITADARATIPEAVLEALGLKPGDPVAFDIVDGEVTLHRADAGSFDADEGRSIEEITGLDFETLRSKIRNSIDNPGRPLPVAESFAEIRTELESRWRADDA